MGAWAKFPTRWILQQKGLNFIDWRKYRSNGIAALLVLIALAIKRNLDQKERRSGGDGSIVVATYDEIQELVYMSRSKVAKGLALLIELKIIERVEDNRSNYRLVGLDSAGGWAKLPQSQLIQSGRISVFDAFHLRSASELHALKLYLLMVAIRDRRTGYAHIGYEKITEYTGVHASNLKRAKSHLISLRLISAEDDYEFAEVKAKPPLRYKILGLPTVIVVEPDD